MTIAGMAAFVAGAVAANLSAPARPETVPQSPEPGAGFERLGWRALAIGAVSYLLLSRCSTGWLRRRRLYLHSRTC